LHLPAAAAEKALLERRSILRLPHIDNLITINKLQIPRIIGMESRSPF
jgi:hypothetical protein